MPPLSMCIFSMEHLLLKSALLDSCLRCHCLKQFWFTLGQLLSWNPWSRTGPVHRLLDRLSRGEGLLPKRTTILGNGRVHRL